jgi:nucleoside-diphosphate-sugar epimerase
MKVAVIGANGFIGTRIVECFHLGGGPEVAAIVRRPSSLALPARFAMDMRVADALDADSLAGGLAGCQAVVHVALGDPAQIRRMPGVLCEAAERAGIRRIAYMSSASVHGQNAAVGTREDSALHTRHALDYNNAKVAAERTFFKECRKRDLTGFALRPSVVFGPRSRWLSDLAEDMRAGRAWLLKEGRGICNSIYVDNLVAAVRACLVARDDAAGAYLVGDAETVTWRSFYTALATEIGAPTSAFLSVDRVPEFGMTWSERAGRVASHPVVQLALPLVPFSLKRNAKRILSALAADPNADSWALPEGPKPNVTREMADLQACEWKLPSTRAQMELGFVRPVSFSEGMRRTAAWWRFSRGELRLAV